MVNNPVKITDTTFRDAHQSIMATRMRFEDMEPIASQMDEIGFHSLEVWGGATFDATTRFLDEDPWDRLRKFKFLIKKTPLMMLLRGQSLVGYRHYADDVVEAFVERSAEAGIDIYRLFDALNDERNLESSSKAIKKVDKHLQMTVCYSVANEGKLGGPIYNIDYFVKKAVIFQDMGADSICIKDMAGLLAPYDAFELITALKQKIDVPIQLHTHYTSGMASMTVMKSIEAGVDIVDTCLAPLAMRTSQPAVEPLITSLRGGAKDTGIDLESLIRLGDYLESIMPKYSEHMENTRTAVIDARVLAHQIPGGMVSNLIAQLKEADALDRLKEVFEEIPPTRKDLGYPPLVTPISQMIGSQAVSNVLFGRYKMISSQIKDYAFGLYGQAPSNLDPEFVKTALSGYPKGQTPTSVRPADLIEPELDKAKEAIKDISDNMDDVLTYAIYPISGLKFLRSKHGIQVEEKFQKVPTLAKPVISNLPVRPKLSQSQDRLGKRSVESKTFKVSIDNKSYLVEVESFDKAEINNEDETIFDSSNSPHSVKENSTHTKPALSKDDFAIRAPMPGIIAQYTVEVGQRVEKSDVIIMLEAMKMENSITSHVSGIVKNLVFENGDRVEKNDILAIITNSLDS